MSTPNPEARPLHLADTPGYPLARTVELPDTVGHPTGSLSIRFGALQVSAEGRPEAVAGQEHTYRLPALVLTGRYALDTRPDEIRDLDTAGDLRPLSEEARRPTLPAASRAAAVTPDPPDEETLRKWRDRADTHRDKLMRTEKGQQLLITYGQNNETFYGIFDSSSTLRKNWRRNGVTRRMSEHTYTNTDLGATGDGANAVNDWTDPDQGTTYNSHAFIQYVNVTSALSFEMGFATAPEDQSTYGDALDAAQKFATAVNDTGNSGEQTTPLTHEQIYTSIEQHPGEVRATTPGELDRYVGLVHGTYSAAPEDEPDEWFPLSEEHRERYRRFGKEAYEARAQEQPAATHTLHRGDCHARLDGVLITVDPAQAAATVTLPPLALHIDDADWRGPVGELARERLRTMRFVQELLRDAVAETLRHAALTGIAGFGPPGDGRS
ncbi:hypothetical protein GCM10010387_37710 [Streptomyces inusitatus]|uniref:Uncharacterized protein n=1 Tax=Streptomyces inusitatus TaxID=68221 RepID=A0A918QBM8_9ACTN|nr:hypothetical protein [Streptomyces inusitatus]GGZ39810.1 hypothetical protein GCM10010387_37710 [Streptomyces inusitatus]